MHRIQKNLVRSMGFASGLPLRFWDDAAEYAVYISTRSPTKGDLRHVSIIKMLNKTTTILSGIAVFGSPSHVYTIEDGYVSTLQEEKRRSHYSKSLRRQPCGHKNMHGYSGRVYYRDVSARI